MRAWLLTRARSDDCEGKEREQGETPIFISLILFLFLLPPHLILLPHHVVNVVAGVAAGHLWSGRGESHYRVTMIDDNEGLGKIFDWIRKEKEENKVILDLARLGSIVVHMLYLRLGFNLL